MIPYRQFAHGVDVLEEAREIGRVDVVGAECLGLGEAGDEPDARSVRLRWKGG